MERQQHYWDLWSLSGTSSSTAEHQQGMSALSISDTFHGETVTIAEEDIEAFCRVVGNEGESYKRNVKGGMQVPMDFAIKLGWKVRFSLLAVYAFAER